MRALAAAAGDDRDRQAGADPALRAKLEADIQSYQSRIYQLEFWGDRIISKIQMRVDWEFEINGPQVVDGALGGRVDVAQPWRIGFWFGGWDGDLLIGFARGTLGLPFLPS